jgi:hypothetical protein
VREGVRACVVVMRAGPELAWAQDEEMEVDMDNIYRDKMTKTERRRRSRARLLAARE